MKTLALAIALLALPRLARADGWWKACDSDNDPSNGSDFGCGGGACQCSSTSDAASIGGGLALTGLVAFGIGRKRRRR